MSVKPFWCAVICGVCFCGMLPVVVSGARAEEPSATAEDAASPACESAAEPESAACGQAAEPESAVSRRAAVPLVQEKTGSEVLLFGEYMSLDQLLQQRLGISTIKELTPREAPGIVAIITSDEIANSGARDFMDVLRLIPAFEFGCDVSGVVDMSVRGLWTHEGKVLFLLDGQPINEIAYGTMMYGNHFPVDSIKQVEIIRGPGSAVYGGYAEFGVIHIKTKNGRDIDGASFSGEYSQMARTFSHRNLNLSAGKAAGDLDVSAHVEWGQGNRSDGTFTSYYLGETYDMKDNAQLNPFLANLGIAYKGLKLRSIVDQYRTTERDWWGANLPQAVRADFDTYILDAQYDWKFGNWTLTPRVNLKEQAPYKRNGIGTKGIIPETYTDADDFPFEVWVKRQTESLVASYDFCENNNLLAGIEAYQEQGETTSDALPRLLQYHNLAVFAQGLVDLVYVNLTAGARFERHSQYGNSFVPRAGLTKVLGDWHFKLLYAQAFRVPQLETIVLNPEIKPETSTTLEFETGYKVTDKMIATVNVFDTLVQDNIIYYVTDEEHQENSGRLGTRGAEVELKYRDTWGFVNLGYSFNHITQNEVFIYQVPGHEERVIGLPGHKAVLNANFRILGPLSLNPSVVWFSQRYGFARDGEGVAEFEPVLLANCFATYAVTQEFRIGLGVNDITDARPVYIQAYNGGHAPIPGPSRAVVAKVWYDVKF